MVLAGVTTERMGQQTIDAIEVVGKLIIFWMAVCFDTELELKL